MGVDLIRVLWQGILKVRELLIGCTIRYFMSSRNYLAHPILCRSYQSNHMRSNIFDVKVPVIAFARDWTFLPFLTSIWPPDGEVG